jgi:hypothetical protein
MTWPLLPCRLPPDARFCNASQYSIAGFSPGITAGRVAITRGSRSLKSRAAFVARS